MNQPQAATRTTTTEANIVDWLLDETRPQVRQMEADLRQRVQQIESALPVRWKGRGEELAKTALFTFAKKSELMACPPADFVRCVVEAARIGLAIDGKRGYVVKYASAYQFQADYKAVVDLARQNGLILDCFPRLVYSAEHFEMGEHDGQSFLRHTIITDPKKRGILIGAYAKVVLRGGFWRAEYMDMGELNKVRDMAPAKNGPWRTWTEEQYKKTVVRRAMKMYATDPEYNNALREPWESDSVQPTLGSISAEQIAELEALDLQFEAESGQKHTAKFWTWACYGSAQNSGGREGSASEVPVHRFGPVKKALEDHLAKVKGEPCQPSSPTSSSIPTNGTDSEEASPPPATSTKS